MFPLSGRGIVLPENHPASPFRRVNAGSPLLVPTTGKEVTAGTRKKEQKKRTQETFGATTPGRRVLYSASWVLAASPLSGDAAVL
jgi:hypothetical protein